MYVHTQPGRAGKPQAIRVNGATRGAAAHASHATWRYLLT